MNQLSGQVRALGKSRHAELATPEAFNWTELLAALPDQSYYLVVFRSHRRAGANHRQLWREDALAFAEAADAGGLVHYHTGLLDRKRRCISFCVWRSEADARRATALPVHREAAKLALLAYDSYSIERYTIGMRDGEATFDLLGTSEAVNRELAPGTF